MLICARIRILSQALYSNLMLVLITPVCVWLNENSITCVHSPFLLVEPFTDVEEGKRQRKSPVRFKPSIDIILMKSTLEHDALLVRYGNTRSTWDRVSEDLMTELHKKKRSPDVFDARRCQERVKRLLEFHRDQNYNLSHRATNEELSQVLALLPQIAQADAQRKSKRSVVSSSTNSPVVSPNTTTDTNTGSGNTGIEPLPPHGHAPGHASMGVGENGFPSSMDLREGHRGEISLLQPRLHANDSGDDNEAYRPNKQRRLNDSDAHTGAGSQSSTNVSTNTNTNSTSATSTSNNAIPSVSVSTSVSIDEIMQGTHKAAALFERFLSSQQTAVEQIKALLAKQVDLEERRLRLEQDQLEFAKQQQQLQQQHLQQQQQLMLQSQPRPVSLPVQAPVPVPMHGPSNAHTHTHSPLLQQQQQLQQPSISIPHPHPHTHVHLHSHAQPHLQPSAPAEQQAQMMHLDGVPALLPPTINLLAGGGMHLGPHLPSHPHHGGPHGPASG
jgi:hypothetical protein